jgi:hypothetical protein
MESKNKKLTEAQDNVLDALRKTARQNLRGDGRRVKDSDKGGVSMRVLDCYDWRTLRGLFARGLLVWAQPESRYDAFVSL